MFTGNKLTGGARGVGRDLGPCGCGLSAEFRRLRWPRSIFGGFHLVKIDLHISPPPHVATPLARRQKVVQAKVIASSATGRRSEGPRKSPPPPPIAKYSLLGIQAHRRQTVGFPRPQRQAESQQKWTVCFFTSHSGSREGRQPGKKLGSSLVNSKSNAVYCLHPPNPSTSFSLPT